jgi:hypothetical protein
MDASRPDPPSDSFKPPTIISSSMSLPSGRFISTRLISHLSTPKLNVPLAHRSYASIAPRPPDVREFLAGYPSFPPNPSRNKNLDFYSGKGKAQPDGLMVDELLDRLERDFGEVERNQYASPFALLPFYPQLTADQILH